MRIKLDIDDFQVGDIVVQDLKWIRALIDDDLCSTDTEAILDIEAIDRVLELYVGH